MDYINGTYRLLYLKVDGVYTPIGCLTSNDFSENVDMLPTTTRENKGGWRTAKPTNQTFDISFSGLVTKTNRLGTIISYVDLQSIKRLREPIEWRIDDGLGDFDFGYGYITSLSNSASIEEMVSFSGSIQGYGRPTNEFENIYYGYIDRVEANGGEITDTTCLELYVRKLLI